MEADVLNDVMNKVNGASEKSKKPEEDLASRKGKPGLEKDEKNKENVLGTEENLHIAPEENTCSIAKEDIVAEDLNVQGKSKDVTTRAKKKKAKNKKREKSQVTGQ